MYYLPCPSGSVYLFTNQNYWKKSKVFTIRNYRVSARRETNRYEETVMMQSIECDKNAANQFERVLRLIDVSTYAAEPEISRMRKLLIELKKEHPSHTP